jgi:predicted RNA-binding Zn-ribbon protein involved in translation (DUF1610 family)
MSKYYTYISVNHKCIRIEESETEHIKRVRMMLALERRRHAEEEEQKIGLHKGVYYICPGCGAKIPSTTQVRSGNYYCKHCGRAGRNYTDGPAV